MTETLFSIGIIIFIILCCVGLWLSDSNSRSIFEPRVTFLDVLEELSKSEKDITIDVEIEVTDVKKTVDADEIEYRGMDSTDNPRYPGRTYKYLEIGSADNTKHTEKTYEYLDSHNIQLKM